MGKKLIYLLLAVFLGGFIVIQSCNESPIVTNEPFEGLTYDFEKMEANGITTVNLFGDWDKPEYPVRCDNGERIKIWGRNVANMTEWIHVGYVEYYCVQGSYNKIRVKFSFINPDNGPFPWTIKKICFNMENSIGDFPRKSNGAPDVDRFDIHQTFSAPDYFTENIWEIPQYTLPHDWWWGDATRCDDYYVMTYVELCYSGGAEGFEVFLPNEVVTYRVEKNKPESYFKITFLENGGILGTGTYEGYCVDADRFIYPPVTLTGTIHTSTSEVPPECLAGAIENWSQMNRVNWIINNYPVGSSVQQCTYTLGPEVEQGWPFEGTFTPQSTYGTVTWQELQAAIWAFLEGVEPLSVHFAYLNIGNINNVWGIVNAALNDPLAAGFIPTCYDKITAILCPGGNGNIQIITIQPTIIQFNLPCDTKCYTAWGDGKYGADFPCYSQWATYFKWNPECHY